METINNSDGKKTKMTRQEMASAIHESGYVILENVLDPDFIVRCKKELEFAIEDESKKLSNNPYYRDYGMVMLCALYGGAFLELFDNKGLFEPFGATLGDSCIVYAYTSSSMPPNKSNYSNRIHVDSPRLIPGYVTNMGATILLDDFTELNGATYFLPGSHRRIEPPAEEVFLKNAKRLIAKAGSVIFFDARLWHLGGKNQTSRWRHALTLNICRPFMKQRIDIPRALAHMDLSHLSDFARQKLGFFSQMPASLNEYYVAPEWRKFRQSNE